MGMYPSFIPASDDMTIIMNTMPDAPSGAVPGKNSHCTSPDTSAVRNIAQNRLRPPYFSSSGGPTTSIIIMLPI